MEHSETADAPAAAPPRTTAEQGSPDIVGLRVRSAILVALGALSLFAADFWFGSARGCHFAALLFLSVGLAEFYSLCRAKGAKPLRGLGIIAAVGLVIVQIACIETGASLIQPLAVAGIAVMLTILIVHMGTSKQADFMTDVAATVLGLLYVWFLGIFFIIGIRHLPNGFAAIIIMLFAAKGGDSIAYGVGRKIGRTKMIPRISPKKSWEGGIAGVLGAVAIAVFLNWLFARWEYTFAEMWWAAVLGLAIGVSSIVGDLIESCFKRSAGVKDSSLIFRWYGGVLDVGDSLIVSSPVVYFLLVSHGS